MTMKKNFIAFWKKFLQPRVIIFVFVGTSIIFLTFLTNNNALEISISAVASIFIGIGANNFSMPETSTNTNRKNAKMLYLIKTFEFIQSRLNRLDVEAGGESAKKIKQELSELEQLIGIAIHLMNEDDPLS